MLLVMELFAECPYCWSPISILADEGGGGEQRYVEDCEVCCRPLQVTVRLEPEPSLDVRRMEEV